MKQNSSKRRAINPRYSALDVVCPQCRMPRGVTCVDACGRIIKPHANRCKAAIAVLPEYRQRAVRKRSARPSTARKRQQAACGCGVLYTCPSHRRPTTGRRRAT